jgi:Phosphotransferase enzyme family
MRKVIKPSARSPGVLGHDGRMAQLEVPLVGGDVTEGLVRVGDTVRRPRQPWSDGVAAYLDHLAAVGFAGAPRWHGVDEAGRDILDFLPGAVPGSPPEPWSVTDPVLADVAALLRRLHAASESFVPPAGARWFGTDIPVELPPDIGPLFDEPELVSHSDVTPQNVVFRAGRPAALIDFDMTRPTTRLADVVNTALHWVPLKHPLDRGDVYADLDIAARLRVFVDAYGLDAGRRAGFLDLARRGARRSWHLMHANARLRGGGWARMWDEGVGDQIRRRQEWLVADHDALAAALDAG